MILILGVVNYSFFVLSFLLFLSAIVATPSAVDEIGKKNVENLLKSSLVIGFLFVVGSVGLLITLLVKSIRNMNGYRVRTTPSGSEGYTDSP
jgi:hypothetical protein